MEQEYRDRIRDYLDYLYYDINKQQDYQLQSQGIFISKRKDYFNLRYNSSEFFLNWWLSKLNNRTILSNEICLDYDPPEKWNKVDIFRNVKHLISRLEKIKNRFDDITIWSTGSKGIHVHMFDTKMYKLEYCERIKMRLRYFEMLPMFKEFNDKIQKLYPERLKISENVTIALEHARHNKTNKIKTLIYKV